MSRKIIRILPILAAVCALAMLQKDTTEKITFQPQTLKKQAIAKIIATHDIALILKKLKQLPPDLQTDIIQAMIFDPRFSQQDLQYLLQDLLLSLPKDAENNALLAAYGAALNSDPIDIEKKINQIHIHNYPTLAYLLMFKNATLTVINIEKLLKMLFENTPKGIKEHAIISFFLSDLFKFLATNRGELLKNGFNVILKYPENEDYPTTPLMQAIFKRNILVTDFLLEHGANPNFRSIGADIPLNFAITIGFPEIVKKLLEFGATRQPGATSKIALDPLYDAAYSNNEEIIKILLHAGSNINKIYARYSSYRTILDQLIKNRTKVPAEEQPQYDNAIALLRKYGAKTYEELQKLP